jgi:hypothetical protein
MILCLLTDDNNKPNHNTTTYFVYWRTTKTTNPIMIRPHIVFTDGRQKRQTQSWFDHILCLLTDDKNEMRKVWIYQRGNQKLEIVVYNIQ